MRVIYVNADSGQDSNSGSRLEPMKTIQAAVDSTREPVRIRLEPGVHTGPLSSFGYGRPALVHIHNNREQFRPTRNRLNVTAPVVIEGWGEGASISIPHHGRGIYCHGGAIVGLSNLIIRATATKDCPAGIVAHSGSHIIMAGVKVLGNTAIETGVLAERSANIEAFDCLAYNCTVHGARAVTSSVIQWTCGSMTPFVANGFHLGRPHYAQAAAHKHSFLEIWGKGKIVGLYEAKHGSSLLVGSTYRNRYMDISEAVFRLDASSASFEYTSGKPFINSNGSTYTYYRPESTNG